MVCITLSMPLCMPNTTQSTPMSMSPLMKTTAQKTVVLDKTAGLESHQFSREENRFNTIANPVPLKNIRQPRVGFNTRNNSNTVFQFGSNHGYQRGIKKLILDLERFSFSPIDQAEKQRKEVKREKFSKRVVVKRY
jgi:hypothetical protein